MGDESVTYHYWRDDQRHPRVTLCRLVRDGVAAYGWSIAGPSDVPCYAEGRIIAYTRAHWAFSKAGRPTADHVRGRVWGRFVRRPEALDVIADCDALSFITLAIGRHVMDLPAWMQPPTQEPCDAHQG